MNPNEKKHSRPRLTVNKCSGNRFCSIIDSNGVLTGCGCTEFKCPNASPRIPSADPSRNCGPRNCFASWTACLSIIMFPISISSNPTVPAAEDPSPYSTSHSNCSRRQERGGFHFIRGQRHVFDLEG